MENAKADLFKGLLTYDFWASTWEKHATVFSQAVKKPMSKSIILRKAFSWKFVLRMFSVRQV